MIDVFCKKTWAIALKVKSAEAVINAMKIIFKDRTPKYLQSDKGWEFINSKVQNFLKDHGIKFYTANNPDVKAAVIECFNKTLKNKMYKYFTHASTLNYVDVLDDLIHSYNNTIHSAINMAPNDVSKDIELLDDEYLYSGRGRYKKYVTKGNVRYSIGDRVRITREKFHFEQCYRSNWSRVIFTIHDVVRSIPTRYKIKDLNGEIIEGTF
jgi:predicted Fe-Mo cluster-binding NifX family protein